MIGRPAVVERLSQVADPERFRLALASVLRSDGVLVIPAGSHLWCLYDLIRPESEQWTAIPPKFHPHAPTQWVRAAMLPKSGPVWVLYSSRAGQRPHAVPEGGAYFSRLAAHSKEQA